MSRVLTLEYYHQRSSATAGPPRTTASEPPPWAVLFPQEQVLSGSPPVSFPNRHQSVAASTTSRGSSAPIFTPESSRSPSIVRSDTLFPEPILPRRVSPDEPIPSVETEAWTESPISGASIPRTPNTRPGAARASTSPLTSAPHSPLSYRAADSLPGERYPARDSPEIGSITDRLDRLIIERLDRTPVDMGLSDIRAALSNLFDDAGRRTPQPSNPTPAFRQSSLTPRPPRRSRGRSEAALVYHDVKDEELPESRFYDPAVQNAIKNAKALMTQLAGVLEDSPLHINPDSTIRRLYGQALDLSQFEGPSTRTVGFVGDSGVGERLSNSGAACTCVVTEYHHKDGDAFTIDVELFSQDELMDQMKELLQSYRMFHLNAGELRRNDEAATVVDIEEQANVARDTFRSLFRGQLASEDFLINEEEATVLRTFHSWLRRVDLPLEGRHEKPSRDSCAAFLMYLTSESVDTRTPAVWPFVRKIKVFLPSHILSKGLILVDLPGLRDSNSARRLITERYLVEYDEIFAICNIGRATTDVGVESVFELAQQAGLSKVGIVCTKSDDIRVEEAMKDWRGRHADRIQQLSNAVSTTEADIENINLDLAEIDELEMTELTDEEQRESIRLHNEQRRTNAVLKKNLFELKEYLIKTRNAIVTRQLRTAYEDKIAGGNLAVFCVSNILYWDERHKPRDVALPSLQLSGILALRKHCLGIIADSQLSIAKRNIDNDIPAMLGEAALWVESGAGSTGAEQKLHIRDTLNLIESRLKRDLTRRNSDLSLVGTSIKDDFRIRIYDNRRNNTWMTAAANAALEWDPWAPGTYSAFCRNFGNHRTRIAGWHDWNQELICTMARDVTPQWDSVCTSCRTRLEQSCRLIQSQMDWALEFLENELELFPGVTDLLQETLICHKNIMESQVEDLTDKTGADLNSLRIDVLTGIRTSILGQAMETPYRRCNAEYDKLRSYSPHLGFKSRMRLLADNVQTELQAIVRDGLAAITSVLDLIRNDNVATESEENPELRRRLEQEIATIKERMRRIMDIMDGSVPGKSLMMCLFRSFNTKMPPISKQPQSYYET
ncbi:uncharacterized protein CLUP02_17649 [Colletotrichum lupini]|uniref:DUF7605 domain-containing protein n=1 Tax=Colletotrichum lupini TaxID=145971 RepID=A0A9Q8SFI4_9PEZI|nr:uncharacterized protein CLUP02_17649 [Colletotrichum lupini]UQC76138.1 hypothetical protein CLUP02_17649 [Colletotrichum lupini]